MRNVAISIIVTWATLALAPTPAAGQPVARTPDGKPDLSGVWQAPPTGKYVDNIAADLEPGDVQPWAEKLVLERRENFGKDHPRIHCLPWGPNGITGMGEFRIVQTPTLIVILKSTLAYRLIHMDGRTLEPDSNPSWMGYSVGRWDGDTLVVESAGFNDKTWLDYAGHPTEALRVTERYRRRDFGHLDLDVTLDDPAVYARPWTVTVGAEFFADTELLESVCAEGKDKALAHWVGTISDDRNSAVTVAPAILATYVGTYVEQPPFAFGRSRTIEITRSGDALFASVDGGGRLQLLAQSDTLFSSQVTIEFVRDGKGVTTHLLDKRRSNDYRFQRMR